MLITESHREIYQRYAMVPIDGPKKPPTPNRGYWEYRVPPEEIQIATASIRKLLMAVWLARAHELGAFDDEKSEIKDFFPVNRPEELKRWLMAHVGNGDGTLVLGEKVFVGIWKGVPVYGVAAAGESKKNTDPVLESLAKIQWLRAHPLEDQERDIIITAGDTIERVGDGMHSYGKPINEERYPQRRRRETANTYAKRLSRYNAQYIRQRYQPGSIARHVVGMAAVGLQGYDTTEIAMMQLRYRVPLIDLSTKLVIDPEAGGGGVTPNIILHSTEYQNLTPFQQIALLCRIMGMPFVSFMELAKRVREKQGDAFTVSTWK